ncbi:MAG: hypothetical protein HGGPFJEG_01669 [Ignavibacteria bacterium]|nr:hypothetical protein [Ignavibacteria bacterium]
MGFNEFVIIIKLSQFFMYKISKLKIIVIALFLISTKYAFPQNVAPDKKILNDEPSRAERIIDEYKPALISIWFVDNDYYSYGSESYIDTTILNGSGFFFNESGLIGTNYHVIENIDSIIVKTSEGKFYNAELIIAEEKNDFAIIKILNADNKKFPVIKFGNSDELKAGQEVFAIGSPLGFEYTLSSGIIAAVRENESVNFADPITYETETKSFEKVIQITAPISPGNSGGALFNSKGEVIGITTYTYTGYGNLNFAIAANTFQKLISLAESNDFEKSEELIAKKEENQFQMKFNSASALKTQLSYNWYFSKLKDTSKTADNYTLKQDSINKINFAKAESYYFECMELKPDTFAVYQSLFDLYVITDNFEKADDLYKKIENKFDSDSLKNLLALSLTPEYSSVKNSDIALKFYQKLLEQDKTQSYVYFKIASIYEEKKNYKKALEEYKKLLKIDTMFTEAYFKIGKIYYSDLKNPEKAKFYFNKAYERELIYSGYSEYITDLYYYMGMIAVQEGRKYDAMLSYLELKSSYNSTDEGIKKRIELYRAIKSMEE